MRSFLLLTSLMALVLGFAGTAMGVRPRPAAADTTAVEEQVRVLASQVTVLAQALEDLERRFEDHRARTPVTAIATSDEGPAAPAPEADDAVDAPRPELVTPPALVLAALERAEEHVQAGDSRGARDLFRALLDGTDLTPALRVRARIGVAASWEILEAWAEAAAELDRAEKEIAGLEGESAEIHRAEVASHRKRVAEQADRD